MITTDHDRVKLQAHPFQRVAVGHASVPLADGYGKPPQAGFFRGPPGPVFRPRCTRNHRGGPGLAECEASNSLRMPFRRGGWQRPARGGVSVEWHYLKEGDHNGSWLRRRATTSCRRLAEGSTLKLVPFVDVTEARWLKPVVPKSRPFRRRSAHGLHGWLGVDHPRQAVGHCLDLRYWVSSRGVRPGLDAPRRRPVREEMLGGTCNLRLVG